MARDWHAWYAQYDDPSSSLSRRLEVVRARLADVLATRGWPAQVISMCSGDGRDTLPVLAGLGPKFAALLVELDPDLASAARLEAARLRLTRVLVRNEDAGTTDAYRGWTPADVVLACGVFGNITDDDVERTIRALPGLLTDHGVVIWTRGSRVPQDPTEVSGDPSEHVRALFADAGFAELSFDRPEDAGFRVGVHRLDRPRERFQPGLRMFDFV
jgi:hypothetical protein